MSFPFFKKDPKPSSHITQHQKTRRRLTICGKPNASTIEKNQIIQERNLSKLLC